MTTENTTTEAPVLSYTDQMRARLSKNKRGTFIAAYKVPGSGPIDTTDRTFHGGRGRQKVIVAPMGIKIKPEGWPWNKRLACCDKNEKQCECGSNRTYIS